MKQSNVFIKLMSVLLTFCFGFSAIGSTAVLTTNAAQYDNYENMSSAEKQAYLEQKLKEVDNKLYSLGKQSKETEDYINTLDERIGFLNKELQLAKNTIQNSKSRITTLENQYKENEENIKTLQQDIENLAVKEQELQAEFDTSYEQYSQRARALYISGDMSMLSMLLNSGDISTLFTRLEMIKRVSKHDKELLENLQNEGNALVSTKADLEDKKSTLTSNQESLISTKENLNQTIKNLEAQQIDYDKKEKDYAQEKQEADRLLLQLHADTETYSEFRNEDLEELRKVNAEIEQAALEWQKRQESLATTKPSTTQSNDNSDNKPTTPQTQAPTKPSGVLQLTYPVPSQTKITCGWREYTGHSGADFACSSNSKVVAAEDGEVIKSVDKKCNGCSNSYHGGGYCSYGRYIVIAHYKKDSKGNYVYTLYAHNSTRLVSEGDKVTKGQQIAWSGSTGNSSGPHCHFEVRTPGANYNDCVNPKPYLP